jgi:GT2 family glycosyltransferase
MKMNRIAVLVSCFNRKATTLAGLESLFGQKNWEGLSITVFLVDDASTDGTADAVTERFPTVRLILGDGSLWWAGAMRKAFAAAMEEGFDGYLWWNDDTRLVEDALQRLVSCAQETDQEAGPAIVVGSTSDPESGQRTYGGFRKHTRGLRFDLEPVEPSAEEALPIDTMNGNIVLIPSVIAGKVGNMDSTFLHLLADVDYGQRTVKAGFRIVLAPGYLGTCRSNPTSSTWKDTSIPLAARLRDIMSPRGIDPREWWIYTRRHFGWRWPIYFVSPYFNTLTNRLFADR